MGMYYVINNMDGDTIIHQYSKEALLKAIEDGDFLVYGIFDKLPNEHDTNYWGGKTLIIKGDVVSPIAKQVVTKYDI